ncbi:MAG: substrate-binding domain-containing protein [Planctomycetota bacterium]
MATASPEFTLSRIRTPRQRRVLRHLMKLAESKDDRDGRLPSERELAEAMSVSRPTVRAVLGNLQEMGYIQPHGLRGRKLCFPADQARELQQQTATGPRTLLDNTVVLLTERPAGDDDGTLNPASDAMIEAALLGRVRGLGGNAMALSPGSLTIETLRTLVVQRPRAIVGLRDMSGFRLSDQARTRFTQAGIPLVIYSSDPSSDAAVRVGSNHRAGCKMLTEWLIGRSCHSILPVWTGFGSAADSRPWIHERQLGYREACEGHGHPSLDPLYITLSGTITEARSQPDAFDHAVRQITGFLIDKVQGPNRVDALIATSDHHAALLAEVCRRLGIDPQRDIQIVGYDHNLSPAFPWDEKPFRPAATIDKNNRAIGRALAEAAMAVGRASDHNLPTDFPGLVQPGLVVHP